MVKIVAMLSLYILSFLVGIWIMISGWGLDPYSWGVIVGGFFLNMFIVGLIQIIAVVE